MSGIIIRRLRKSTSLLLIAIIMLIVSSSCKADTEKIEKIRDLDYTVVEEANIPKELLASIQEKKTEPFKLTLSSEGKEYLYIVVGYGAQATGGYSIQVEDLFLTKNAIYINTNLVGPKKEELVTQVITYPYIVIKTEFIDRNVVFQ